MRIEVLGMGCAKCKRLEENVHEAVRETGVGAIVVKVQDPDQIIGRGSCSRLPSLSTVKKRPSGECLR
jgi:hypothetical protein